MQLYRKEEEARFKCVSTFLFAIITYHLMMDKKTGKGCSLSKSFSVVLLTLALMMRDPQTYVI